MLSALLLFAAATFGQQTVEKIPIQHVTAESVLKAVEGKVKGIDRIVSDPTDNSLIVKGAKDAIALLRDMVSQVDQRSEVRDIPIRHVSAQYLYEVMTATGRFKTDGTLPNFLPVGVTLSVAARTNALIAHGPVPLVRETELLLEQLDIQPKNLSLEVKGSVVSLGRTFSTTTEIANGATWTYTDPSSDVKLQVRGLINGDSSVTLLVSGSVMTTETKWTIRLKKGQTCYMRIDPFNTGKDKVVNYFVRDAKIDEAAFLSGVSLAKFDSSVTLDNNEAMPGEMRLLVTASPK